MATYLDQKMAEMIAALRRNDPMERRSRAFKLRGYADHILTDPDLDQAARIAIAEALDAVAQAIDA